jgi:hypothetical protein
MTDWEVPLPVLVAVVAITTVLGWICIFRTSKLVTWAQNNYRKSKVLRWWPGSSLVMKPWYPRYLCCMGVYAWAFGGLTLGLFIISAVRH